MNSIGTNKRLSIVLCIGISFITFCREPELTDPKYDVNITEFLLHKKNFRIKKRHLNGKPRHIVIDRSFSTQSLKFYRYSEWFWSKRGRIERMLPGGVTPIQGIPCKEHQFVFFHSNGNLAKCTIGKEKWKYGRFTSEDKLSIEFHPNGKLKLLMLADSYRKNGIEYAVVRFTEDGTFIPDRPPELRHEIQKIE